MDRRQQIIEQARRLLGTADAAAEAAARAAQTLEDAAATRTPPHRRGAAAGGGLESFTPSIRSSPMGGPAVRPAVESREPRGPLDHPSVTRAIVEERNERIADGVEAMKKIEMGQEDQITPRLQIGLEAIVLLTGRPAILIQEGDFMEPPKAWEDLKPMRAAVQAVIQRVGRIEVAGNPNFDWLGTGFLAGDGTVLTNRHVAQEFARNAAPDAWTFRAPMTASLDLKAEFGGQDSLEFAVTEIVGIHDALDLAVLRVERTSVAGALPDPLPVAAAAPTSASLVGRKVYVIGYPAWDGRRNDPEPMRRIFSEIYNVKRLQPGELSGAAPDAFEILHDCSTLGGNSGSPVVDFETHRVLGLHFGGRYMEKNHAIPLWTLRNDPLVARAALNYQ